MENIAWLIFIFLQFLPLFCNGHKTFSESEVSQFLFKGTQAKRISALSYQKACKCQCKDLTVFNKEKKRREGNCLTDVDGHYWCFVEDDVAPNCRQSAQSDLTDSMFSFYACYTPAVGEGPCSERETNQIESQPERKLSCCSVHVGQYNPTTFEKLTGIKFPCYAPNQDQPDEGCEFPIETTWGPAKPCRCHGIEYVPGIRKISDDSFIHCEVGIAVGSKMIEYTTSTTGLTTVQKNGAWKKRPNCVWRQRPSLSGPWKCI